MAEAARASAAPEITTTAGRLTGSAANGVQTFLGVPYAASPVGERRFAAPQPVEPWTGFRDATQPGANAPHKTKPFPGLDVVPIIGTGWAKGDDFLTLNIWRPDSDASGLPIMVWIHGGGFVLGSKDVPVSDGTHFARDGVICVAINYRLGVEGFLPIPSVPTNLGLRDMLAALRWVQDNAAALGGDASNVTVFGESAGAMAIADLVTSPLAKGLFKRAIIQSGHSGMTRDISVAQRLVQKVAKLLKVTPDATGFRTASPEAALDALEKVSAPTTRLDLRDAQGFEPVFGISRFVPVHGDDLLPEQPLAALQHGAGAEIDILIGTNAEEMNLYLIPTGVREKLGKLLSWFVLRKSHPQPRKILKAYRSKDKAAGQTLVDAMTDLVFRWPARRFAEEHQGKTWMYELDWRSPMFADQLGAAHGMELPFVFDTLATTTGPQGLTGENAPQELATRIHKIWVDFAKTGTLPWAHFDRETRQVYQLNAGHALHEPRMPAADFLP